MSERIRIKDIARLSGVSVGTVDRVLHGRHGVSKESKRKVEEILKENDYKPNMYASALASNKHYRLVSLLPIHNEGEYWTDVLYGMDVALRKYSDFHIDLEKRFYDPFCKSSFLDEADKIISEEYDGVILAPVEEKRTNVFTSQLNEKGIPYIYIDSNIEGDENALSFFGQNPHQSGVFAAQMMSLLANGKIDSVAIFRLATVEGMSGSNQQVSRELGFREYMNTNFPNVKIYELNLDPSDEEVRQSELRNFFYNTPDSLKLGISFTSKAYIIGNYLKENGIKDYYLMGYDLLKYNVKCLKEGNISFLIAQQPKLQGYNVILSMADHLILRKGVQRVNFMPIDLLSMENVDYYYTIK